MAIKTTLNYSPNFDPKKRKNNQIKFLIFHYTGMKTEKAAVNRLTDIESRVSAHYLIKQNGEIITLVPDLYTAWHAGKSVWKNYSSINKDSIGIEIVNPGHDNNYKKFSKIQLAALVRLSKFLIKKYRINSKNILGHSDIAPDRKKDPGEKFPWKYLSKKKVGLWHDLKNKDLKSIRGHKISTLCQKVFLNNLFKIGYPKKILKNISRDKYHSYVVKAFQMRYRQELINGRIDKECLIISRNLIKK